VRTPVKGRCRRVPIQPKPFKLWSFSRFTSVQTKAEKGMKKALSVATRPSLSNCQMPRSWTLA
jgi:hypothetical protein